MKLCRASRGWDEKTVHGVALVCYASYSTFVRYGPGPSNSSSRPTLSCRRSCWTGRHWPIGMSHVMRGRELGS